MITTVSRKALISFGRVMAAGLSIVAGVFFLRGHQNVSLTLVAIGLIFLLLSFAAPILLFPFERVWMGFGLVMGFVVSRTLLALLFFGLMTPMRLIARLVGKRFLDLYFDKNFGSYWIKRESRELAAETYERQF